MLICKASTCESLTLLRKTNSSEIAAYKLVGFLSCVVGCRILTSSCVGWSLSCLRVRSDTFVTWSILYTNWPVGQLFVLLYLLQLPVFLIELKCQITSKYNINFLFPCRICLHSFNNTFLHVEVGFARLQILASYHPANPRIGGRTSM